jgi:two-component system sensor histidine kinase CiaH
MSPMFAPIRLRLVAWTVLIVGLLLVVVGAAVYAAMSRSLMDQVDRYLSARAEQAMRDPRSFLSPPGGSSDERYRAGAFYLIVGPDGRVLANPQRVDTRGLELAQAAGAPREGVTAELGDEPVRLYAHPIQEEGEGAPAKPGPSPRTKAQGRRGPFGAEGSVLVVGQSLSGEERALGLLLLILVGGGIGGLLLSFAGAWFLAGRALVPIQHAFRRQQEFVADASHELRTPLTVLRSATDLLAQHRDEPLAKNAELFDDVRADIARLQRLTGDLLTLARSDRGELELMTAPIDMAALAAEVTRRVVPLAQERGIEIAGPMPGEPAMAEADPDRVQQVLLILLDNAVKHTPAGGRISVDVRPHDGYAVVEVADTGVGIAAEHLPRVFERFYRADASRGRAEGSTGLGLAIAKSLVDAHGGQLALASTPGVGTRATVRLPLARGATLAERIGGLAARITHRPAR